MSADIDAVESIRGLNAAMFAAASNRAEVIEVLAAHGANLKATTKVTDLNSIDRSSYAGILFGNPAPPPAPGQDGRAAAAGLGASQPNPQAGRNVPGGRGQGKAGIDRQYQLNELVSTQGGLTPARSLRGLREKGMCPGRAAPLISASPKDPGSGRGAPASAPARALPTRQAP